MLLQEFWDDRYVGYCERLREVTRVGYESAWRCHVEPVFGSMELADIGVDDIELWLSGFASPGAARKAWAVLRQMLRKAAKWGYLEVDVTRLEIDLPAKPLYVPRLLTIGQTPQLTRICAVFLPSNMTSIRFPLLVTRTEVT